MKKKIRLNLFSLKKKSWLLSLFFTLSVGVFASNPKANVVGENNNYNIVQDDPVSGTVSDNEGIPLPGVTVYVVGNEIGGVSTDFDGNYTLKASEGDVITYSYVGFQTQTKVVGAEKKINVTLEKELSQLDQVIVVGYGSVAKKDITASVATVQGDELVQRVVTNTSNALQGALAGVSVTRESSAPGSGNTIRIRGFTTIQEGPGKDPLILVDNIPVGNLNEVNPDQIESISVLKDGAAASIYGSRAAAGVILITTKRGKNGKFRMSYKTEYAANIPIRLREGVSAVRYMEMRNEALWNTNNNQGSAFPLYDEDLINNYTINNALDPDNFPDVDWVDLLVKSNASTVRHTVNMSGGTKKIKTAANFTFENQDALYVGRNWSRFMARVNNDFKFTDRLSASVDFSFRFIDEDLPSLNPIEDTFRIASIFPAVWSDGRIATGRDNNNPYGNLIAGGFEDNKSYLLTGKLNLKYKLLKNLEVSATYGPRVGFSKSRSFNTSIPIWAADDPEQQNPAQFLVGHTEADRRLNERRDNPVQYVLTTTADYKKSLGNHTFKLLAGYEEFSQQVDNFRLRADGFESNDFPYINLAPVGQISATNSTLRERALQSYFGRFTYDFDGKYLFNATMRRDGSSRFNSGFRWGNFPSVALGWVVSRENFMESLNPTLTFMKLRASYGELGNERLNAFFPAVAPLEFEENPVIFLDANGQPIPLTSIAQTSLAAETLTWETTKTYNFGLDLGFFNDRLSITSDYFIKQTEDMLLVLPVPNLAGLSDPDVNAGSMETKGWEFSASWKDNIKDFNYSVNVNIFDSKTIVGDVNNFRDVDNGLIIEEGVEFRQHFGYIAEGIIRTQEELDNAVTTRPNNTGISIGDIHYRDISGPDGVPDGIITPDHDRVPLGNSRPRFNYGGTIACDYKGFDFNLTFQGVGNIKERLPGQIIQPLIQGFQNVPAFIDGNYWSTYNTDEQNLNARYPRLSQNGSGSRSNNYEISDFWLINGAYFRVKNITLGYTLPNAVYENTFISKCRLYLGANDVFTISDFPDILDPEQDASSYLITRSFLLGAKIEF